MPVFNSTSLGYKRAGAILPAYILVVLIVLVLLFSPLIPASVVLSSGNLVVYESIIGSDVCEITFRHSVNKGMVREIYVLSSDRLMLSLKTGYNESFGAGMIDTIDTAKGLNFRKEGDWFVLDFPENWKKEVHYIGGNIAKHCFLYEDTVVEIGELRSQKPFTISVETRSLIKIFFKIRNLF